MRSAGAVLPQRSNMFPRAVTFMLGKAVLRVLRVQLAHEPVPGDLGQDGRCGDGIAQRVAMDDGTAFAGQFNALHRVQQEKAAWRALCRARHGKARGLQDIERVDLLHAGIGNVGKDGGGKDLLVERLALFGGKFFGVVYAFPAAAMRG